MCFPPPGTSHLEVLTCIIIYHHKTMRVNKWYNTTLRMCESMRGRRRALFLGCSDNLQWEGRAFLVNRQDAPRWHILLCTTTLSIHLLKDQIRLGLGLGLGLGQSTEAGAVSSGSTLVKGVLRRGAIPGGV